MLFLLYIESDNQIACTESSIVKTKRLIAAAAAAAAASAAGIAAAANAAAVGV